MYILNQHPRQKHPWRRALVLLLLVGVVGVGTVVARHMLRDTTTIGPMPKAVVTKVIDKRGAPKHFDQPLFSIDWPADWEVYKPINGIAPLPVISWRNTAENKGVRSADLYIDAIPSTLAVNRMLPVMSNGDRLTLAGDVSDGCEKFTSGNEQAKSRETVPATWQNVHFLCDAGNYVRHVVGIGMPDSKATNSITVTGSATGKHTIFMTYTDSSASANDGIFEAAVQSLKIK